MFKAFAKRGLIEPLELMDSLKHQTIRLIDATYALPNSGQSPQDGFLMRRIPNAVFFDIDRVKDHSTSLPHMLPSSHDFEIAMGGMGITESDCIVIYGQGDMAMGPARLWWMLRVFGHTQVAVLNGGLRAWEHTGGLISGEPFEQPPANCYKAQSINKSLIRDISQMRDISSKALHPILDARPPARFNGAQEEPRAGLRKGHIPNSQNIPTSRLINSETGHMIPAEEIKKLFSQIRLQNSGITLTCGSGVTACMLALGLYTIGYTQAGVYDGSWAEWGAEAQKTPIKQKIQ